MLTSDEDEYRKDLELGVLIKTVQNFDFNKLKSD
jgi:hypothetical protein